MTYLELCQRTHLLLGLGSSGNTAKPGTKPSAVVGQVDELAELVAWVRDEWTEFQGSKRWGWMIQSGTLVFASFNTVTPTTTLPTFAELLPFVVPMPARSNAEQYVTMHLTADSAATERRVRFVPYDEFRGRYDTQTVPAGFPSIYTIRPNRDITVWPTPDASYTMRFDYRTMPQTLTADADTPLNHPATGKGLPAAFHEIICWLACKRFAVVRKDGDMLALASMKIKAQMIPITRLYLPQVRLP